MTHTNLTTKNIKMTHTNFTTNVKSTLKLEKHYDFKKWIWLVHPPLRNFVFILVTYREYYREVKKKKSKPDYSKWLWNNSYSKRKLYKNMQKLSSQGISSHI